MTPDGGQSWVNTFLNGTPVVTGLRRGMAPAAAPKRPRRTGIAFTPLVLEHSVQARELSRQLMVAAQDDGFDAAQAVAEQMADGYDRFSVGTRHSWPVASSWSRVRPRRSSIAGPIRSSLANEQCKFAYQNYFKARRQLFGDESGGWRPPIAGVPGSAPVRSRRHRRACDADPPPALPPGQHAARDILAGSAFGGCH
jgi:hypothetical protein